MKSQCLWWYELETRFVYTRILHYHVPEFISEDMWSFLLTWINFNPSMDN